MDLSDSFELPRPIDEAWAVLTDLEQVAPCIPGALVKEVDGDSYRGVVRVRLGRVNAEYAGTATFLERNEVDHKLVLHGHGLDVGAGDAEALLTVKLEPVSDTTTRVNVDADLTLGGRGARLGRGVIPDVSATLVSRFAENLVAVLDGGAPSRALRPRAPRPGPQQIEMPEPEAIDLLDAARAPLLKRLLIVAVVVLVVVRLARR